MVLFYPPLFFLVPHKSRYSSNHLFLRKILGSVKGSEFCHYMTDMAPQEASIMVDFLSLEKKIFKGKEDLRTKGRIILKWVLQKQGVVMCTEFFGSVHVPLVISCERSNES